MAAAEVRTRYAGHYRGVRRDLLPDGFAEALHVVSVKGDDPRFVAVDGGMADNMEVSLYGQRFEATVTSRVGGGNSVELVGRQSRWEAHPPEGHGRFWPTGLLLLATRHIVLLRRDWALRSSGS